MDVVVCGSVGSGLGGVVAGAQAVQSRNEPDPFANAGHRDVECSAVICAARAHETSHYSPISAWPVPVIRVALRDDSGCDCGYLRGAAKAISGGFCVLHRSDRGVSDGMGYREAVDGRAIVVFGLAVLLTAAAANASRRWLVALAAIVPFLALPYLAGVQNYAPLHTAELDDLAQWARGNTPKEALFQFGDAERRPEPGVFRARAKRALYIDWKAGGQVNFMRPFAMLWAERWEAMKRLQPIEEYRKRESTTWSCAKQTHFPA